MIAAIGWITLALGGAYIVAVLALFFLLGAGLGGLERLPAALFGAAVLAVAWLVLIAYASPLALGWTP